MKVIKVNYQSFLYVKICSGPSSNPGLVATAFVRIEQVLALPVFYDFSAAFYEFEKS